MSPGPTTVIVLAASRGPLDPLARHAGVSHKCLIPISGIAMLDRVIDVLRHLDGPPAIVVAVDKTDIVTLLPEARRAMADGGLRVMAAGPSPSRTILAALQQGIVRTPFLVTTADHPLLTAEMIGHFWRRLPPGIDAAAAVASASTIRHAWPSTQRTYLRFRDGSYSGCNLFAIMTPAAQAVLHLWNGVEVRRKRPLAMMRFLGPIATLRFLVGAMSLAAAVQRLSRLTGTRLAAIDLPFPEAAIDVDKPEDLALVRDIIEKRDRASAAEPAAAVVSSA